MKQAQIIIGGLILLGLIYGGFVWYTLPKLPAEVTYEAPPEVVEPEPEPISTSSIGRSVGGTDITVTTFGTGETHLLFVGGMHGGYEWNSSLLAYEMIDHFTENLDLIPDDVRVSIITDLNPDGTSLVTGIDGRFEATDIPDPSESIAAGRFNLNGVDLNRNFGCKWEPESTWRGEVVSAGESPFSEPEARALRDFVKKTVPVAVVFWHSAAGNVYASECEDGVLPETLELMGTYAAAGDYGEVPVFDAYPITGDAEGWLASINIPAVTVELATHKSIEWSRNLNGTLAVIEKYSLAK